MCSSRSPTRTGSASSRTTRRTGTPGRTTPTWALATSYTPDPSYQHNSTGASNTVTRSARGVYRVTMPGLGVPFVGVNRGTVHVTAFGTTNNRCEVTNWFGGVDLPGNPSPLSIDVACHTAAGAAADSRFVVQYTQ